MEKLRILILVLAFLVGSSMGAPLSGVQGDRLQVNFMSQDPDPVGAGKDLNLRWQIVNTISGTTENLKFNLDVEYPFSFEAGDTPEKSLGTSAGTNDKEVFYVLHYKLRVADNAVKGIYNVTLNWNTGNGWIKKDFPIYIDPKSSELSIGSLITSPLKLVADIDEAKLSVNIDNIGKANAENVKVKLLLPDGFKPTYSYSNEDTLGIIEKGSSKEAKFFVDIDENVKEGEYSAKLEITYKDENDNENNQKKTTLDLKLPIKPAPYLVIESIKTSPENLLSGSKGEIRITVKNSGNEKSDSVSLRIFKDSSQPFDFSEKSDFIGRLESGETGDAVLKLKIDDNAISKKYLLDVELRGIDDKDNVVIFRRTVPVTVEESKKTLPFESFISVLFVFALGFYLRKRGFILF